MMIVWSAMMIVDGRSAFFASALNNTYTQLYNSNNKQRSIPNLEHVSPKLEARLPLSFSSLPMQPRCRPVIGNSLQPYIHLLGLHDRCMRISRSEQYLFPGHLFCQEESLALVCQEESRLPNVCKSFIFGHVKTCRGEGGVN